MVETGEKISERIRLLYDPLYAIADIASQASDIQSVLRDDGRAVMPMLRACTSMDNTARSVAAAFRLLPILGPRRLPLEIENRGRAAAGERPDMVPDLAGACSGCPPRRRAGTLLLGLPRRSRLAALTTNNCHSRIISIWASAP